jgi:hypothetical protein
MHSRLSIAAPLEGRPDRRLSGLHPFHEFLPIAGAPGHWSNSPEVEVYVGSTPRIRLPAAVRNAWAASR